VLLKIWEMFREAGIRVPYPQRDVHIGGADEIGASLRRSDLTRGSSKRNGPAKPGRG